MHAHVPAYMVGAAERAASGRCCCVPGAMSPRWTAGRQGAGAAVAASCGIIMRQEAGGGVCGFHPLRPLHFRHTVYSMHGPGHAQASPGASSTRAVAGALRQPAAVGGCFWAALCCVRQCRRRQASCCGDGRRSGGGAVRCQCHCRCWGLQERQQQRRQHRKSDVAAQRGAKQTGGGGRAGPMRTRGRPQQAGPSSCC